MSINQVMLIGCRTTKNGSEGYKATSDGKSVCRFTVAIDRGYKPKDGSEAPADFISCVSFDDKKNVFIRDRINTKMKINLVGRLQTGSYTNKDGQRVYTTDVVVEELDIADWGDSDGKGRGESVPAAPEAQAPAQPQQQAPVYGQPMYSAPQGQASQPVCYQYQSAPAPQGYAAYQQQYQAQPAPRINPNEKGFI